MTENKSTLLYQEIFSSLNNIECLNNIPNLKQVEYYKLLIEYYNLLSRLKKEYLEQIVAYSNSAEKELVFLETFVEFLNFSIRLQSIIAELKFEEFCCGDLSFGEFLKGVIDLDKITYGGNLTALQEAAKCLLQKQDLFLIGIFKEVISTYIKQVDIQKRRTDNRLVIEVTGKNVVSESFCRLESKLLANSDIKEVRFVGDDIIHIDTNLKKEEEEVWQGATAISPKAIKIHNEVAWIVSGKDRKHIYNSNADIGKDGQGEQGKYGYPAESGSKLLFHVEKIENPENVTNIDLHTFNVTYKIKNTVENIKNDTITVETIWYPGANYPKIGDPDSILASYSRHLRTFQILRSDLENTKERALQAIRENQEKQDKQTLELRTKRSIVRTSQDKNKLSNNTTPRVSYIDTSKVNSLINKLKVKPQLLDNWQQLTGIELTHSEIDELFSTFETVKKKSLEDLNGSWLRWWPVSFGQQSAVENKLNDIELLLIDKYRLATLQEISKQLPPYHEVTDNIELKLESAVRYLVEDKDRGVLKGNNISHPILGTLDQYLYENSKEQRLKISNFCVEELQSNELNVRYSRAAENFLIIFKNINKDYIITKQHITAIISREIKEHKRNLVQIKGYIEETFHKPLSSNDDAYIRVEYMEYCSKFWLQETTEFLKKTTESKSCTLIQENFSSLDKIESLSNIPNFCKQLEYYQLLMQHYKLVSKKNEKNLINQFKEKYLEQIVAFSDSAKKELVFLETFVDILSSSKCLQSIIAELKLEEFCCGELSISEFLKGVIDLDESTYGANLTALQEAANCLQQEQDLYLIGTFKEVISAYIKPVEIQENIIEGRLIIEVTGKNVVVSDILCRLENILLENSKIEEVRFVGADVIHIDINIMSEVWQGKNLVILTKAIKIHNEVVWTVSGKDNSHIYNRNAGTGDDGHGRQGKDGYPGESGGNVLIVVNKIENSENLTIISNGGKGSKGQDGGNGRDGKEGKGITRGEFNRKFPFVADTLGRYVYSKVYSTVENIRNDSLTVETISYPGGNYQSITDYLCRKCADNIFIESVTSQGGRITFSFKKDGFFKWRHAFFLYKGSLGQPGGHGGEYGLGGQGGYAGEVTVRNLENSDQEFGIMRTTKQGKEGEKGQGGLYGRHGKNGSDMGYVDYQLWSQAMFFDQGKYKIEYSDYSTSESVWCPYKYKYARLTAAYNEHTKHLTYRERKNTRQNSGRQHHAQAVRKKNILQGSILATYSHHLSSIEKSILKDLRSDLENTKQRALQAIKENQKQEEKHTMELGIKRSVSSIHQYNKNPRNYYTITPSGSYKDTTNVEALINKLKVKPQLLENWLELRGTELTRTELDDLFSNFETVEKISLEELRGSRWRWLSVPGQQSAVENKLKNIEQLLIDKYRLATLQEIAKQLPYEKVTDNIALALENAVRYLVEDKEKGKNISHPILGTLNQYLYENSKEHRERISKFCEEELQSTGESYEILKRSLKTYILEVAKSEKAHPSIRMYFDENEEFLEKQERNLNILFEKFKSELSRHAEVFDLWIESINDKSLRNELDETIKRDDFLNTLYNQYNNQLKLEYDWDKCCKDQAILKEYKDYIQEIGPLSEHYMELLAYIYDINIRLYSADQENGFSLQDNHNSSSKKVLHVLYRGNEFIQLNINENHLKLEEEYRKKDYLYATILKKIEQLKQKQEFDEYLTAFLADNAPSEDKQNVEEEHINEIIEYFTKEEMQQLKPRLEKIAFQYIGSQGILHYVLKRFSSDGKHVSYQELCYIINSILTFSIEERKLENTFCWIVAAHSQRNWIDELILLQLENHFKRQLEEKSKWREYLSKIENKDVLLLFGVKLDQGGSISTQCIENTLHLLSSISCEVVGLEGLELSEWPYVFKEKYWLCKLLSLTNWQDSDKLPTASSYLLAIENIFGTDLAEKLLGALEEKKQELSPDVLTNILSNFHNEKWYMSEEELMAIHNCDISDWAQNMQQKFTADTKERDITQLVKLIKGNANTSQEISNNLLKIEKSIKTIFDKEYEIDGRFVGSFTVNDIKNWAKETKKNEGKQEIENKMLAVIDRAIELKRGFKLRDTQRLTVLTLLTNNKSTLAQVSTGEGKSLIVVAAALMKALLGEKVDIITSSSVLAKRDAENNRDIYNLFGVNVSHNCSEDIEKRKDAYSSNQVVYGDLSHFQRDYLLDRFYGKNILGDNNFKNIIVDEVDSMLLDKGNNMLYLSHDLPGLDKLESVYIYIWQWINMPAIDYEEMSYAFNIKAIKEAVISEFFGLLKKDDIGKLGSELSEQHKIIIWERLVKAEVLDTKGELLKDNVDDNELHEILLPEFSIYKDPLNYLLKECIGRDKYIRVPNHLRSFIEKNVESWIKSAVTAFFMKAGQDYVVDVDRTGTSPDRNPNITILDRDTGTDQANSQWDDALHQFLQLKHGCKLSLQSLKAVFISNVSFFKLYRNLYGLTGTLGSQRERDLLREIHKVDFVTIPTAKFKQFYEVKPSLCTCKQEWIINILNEVKKVTGDMKRSVLIICETVNDVEVLRKAIGEKYAKHVRTYIRDYEEFDFAQGSKRLDQGQIIIATNLAGRGTDIKISEELRKAGGLHVCLTYLPSNIRVEQQAFGRAARCGDKGSGQLIIIDSKGQQYRDSRILDLKKERCVAELSRISDLKAYCHTQIKIEENCFEVFKVQYEQLKKKLDNKEIPPEVKEILLQSCLDKWAFWLDENSKCIKNMTDKKKKSNFNTLHRQLDTFILELQSLDTSFDGCTNSWLAWVDGNPAQMVKLGKYLSQNKEHENAIKLFDKVIKEEPYFSEAAHYYKAFALTKAIHWEQKKFGEGSKQTLKEFKEELRKAARLFNEHSKNAINAAGIIGKIKQNNNRSIIQIDAYEEQKKSLAILYHSLSQSVDDILGHSITPQSFVNYDVNEELAERLYKDLLEEGILKKPKVKKNISEEKLKTISYRYGVLVETLKSALSRYQDININKFQKTFKKAVPLPSREAFWKLLIQNEVLGEEVKYVAVDSERLREVDPSLMDFLTKKEYKKILKKQTLELNDKQIHLYEELITQQKNNGNVFIKGDFLKIVGKSKYNILKKKKVLTFNKKADINPSKIESVVLPCYDSITIKDFTNKANITKIEGKKILAELVEQQVLEKKDGSDNSAYGLNIKFDEILQVKLLSCPVYENVVRELLSVCFTYRIALQRIFKQQEEKMFPLRLQLSSKPHQSLVCELLEQRIIRPTMVSTEDEDLEEKLKSTYSHTISVDTIKNIAHALKRSRSSLKALKVPDIKLKSLTKLNSKRKFANKEDVNVFFLNGLDLLLQLKEKKWTLNMILITQPVTAMGISKIVIGTLMQLFSLGILTDVGDSLVRDGVHDLLFAFGAVNSGYFSWKDYEQYKLKGFMTSAAISMGPSLSKGAKVSLAGPSFEVSRNKDEKENDIQLIKAVGCMVVGKEDAKRMTLNAIKGVAVGLAYARVDSIVENDLEALCQDISSSILSKIKQEVERHNISITFRKAYDALGEENARKMVIDLSKAVFTEQNYVKKFLPISNKIVSSVTQGIANAVANEESSCKLELLNHIINAKVWLERDYHIANIKTMVGNLLDNLDKKVRKKLDNEQIIVAELDSLNQKREGYEEFKKEMIDECKSLLCEKAGPVISQHIISPVQKQGANHVVKYVKKNLQGTFESNKECGFHEYFEELKQEYKEKLQKQQCNNTLKIEDHIKEKYHKNVLKLMIKTKSSDLLADIVRENIPMDIACVSACTHIIHKIIKDRGVEIPGLTIIVEGDNIRQKCSSASDGAEGIIINLILQDYQFKLCGSGASKSNRVGESKIDYLYNALAEAIPQIRDASKLFHNLKSPYLDEEGLLDYNEYKYRMRSVPGHLQDRLEYFVHLGGIVQRISEQTNVVRGKVVKMEAREDLSSIEGTYFHASHVVIPGKINPTIAEQSEQLYNELANFLEHKQNVPKWAKMRHGIDRKIDIFQSKSLKQLAAINFRENLTFSDKCTLAGMKKKFIAELDKEINGGNLGVREKSKLIKAKKILTNATIESLFEKGKQGYSGQTTILYQ